MFSRQQLDDDFWEELEEVLIVSDVGMNTTMELIERVRASAEEDDVGEPEEIRALLREEIAGMLRSAQEGNEVPDDDQAIILMTGINGAGKTTSIAKLASAAQSQGKSVLLAAADTFRAGAIEQIKIWGERLDIDVIAHSAGGDPGAVAFDAIKAAKARETDLLIIDTAGRLQTSQNLMAEMQKIGRIVTRESGDYARRSILVIDATTGQNGLSQAKSFMDAVGCDAVFLTKLDGSAKGGIVLSIAGDLGLPVWFIGTGEGIDDISTFDPDEFAKALVPELSESAGSAGAA